MCLISKSECQSQSAHQFIAKIRYTLSRSSEMPKIPMSPEVARAMKKQLKAFRKKFHRDPGPNDPIFFDPDADSPQPLSEAT
jgi:hypothetical protein